MIDILKAQAKQQEALQAWQTAESACRQAYKTGDRAAVRKALADQAKADKALRSAGVALGKAIQAERDASTVAEWKRDDPLGSALFGVA